MHNADIVDIYIEFTFALCIFLKAKWIRVLICPNIDDKLMRVLDITFYWMMSY